jgi:hypothetical protein
MGGLAKAALRLSGEVGGAGELFMGSVRARQRAKREGLSAEG